MPKREIEDMKIRIQKLETTVCWLLNRNLELTGIDVGPDMGPE